MNKSIKISPEAQAYLLQRVPQLVMDNKELEPLFRRSLKSLIALAVQEFNESNKTIYTTPSDGIKANPH